eukprot:31502-Pelagococcus_subviridis.AAC.5
MRRRPLRFLALLELLEKTEVPGDDDGVARGRHRGCARRLTRCARKHGSASGGRSARRVVERYALFTRAMRCRHRSAILARRPTHLSAGGSFGNPRLSNCREQSAEARAGGARRGRVSEATPREKFARREARGEGDAREMGRDGGGRTTRRRTRVRGSERGAGAEG